jgi:nucleoside-diphosphate-sugar epimerase
VTAGAGASRRQERFLVTGALGCIGAWTVRELVREGVPVQAFDVGTNHRRLGLIMSPEELARVTFVVGDITDLDAVERAIADHGVTNVIHLAALQVPFCRADPPLGARVNVIGTVNVFEAVRRQGDGMAPIVYTSSIAVYAPTDVDPSSGSLPETADAHPGSHYGVYKLANEGNARVYWTDSNVASIGIRPMTVFGPGRDQGMTSGPTVAIAAAVLGVRYRIAFGGSTLFQYAEDVARTLVLASRSGLEGANVYSLGGSVVSIAEWVRTIETQVPEAAGLIEHEPAPLPFPAEIEHDRLAAIGDVPVTPYEAAIAATVERFRAAADAGRLVAAEQGIPAPVA